LRIDASKKLENSIVAQDAPIKTNKLKAYKPKPYKNTKGIIATDSIAIPTTSMAQNLATVSISIYC
jgi:hypothetical protein